MAIAIPKQPYKFTPASNPVLWQIISDSLYLVYFTCEVKEAISGVTIQRLDLYPSPNNLKGVYIDLSRILSNYVKYQFKGFTENLLDSFDTNLLKYSLTFTEKNLYMTVDGPIIGDGEITTTAGDYVFYGELDKISFKSYRQNRFVVQDGKMINFLTSKPDKVLVNNYSNEGLFFFQDNFNKAISAKYSFYSNSNVAIGTYIATLNTANQTNKKLFRINTSLKTLKDKITAINFSNVSYFTVQLIDSGNTPLSELKTYLVEDIPCSLTPFNIIWVNQFGVLETYQFVNSESTLSVTKNIIQKNPNKANDIGVISNYADNVFNVVDEVLNSTTEQIIRLNTRVLSDYSLKWISGIINTKQCWIEVYNDLFVPVLVNDTSITLTNQRYLTQPNVKQISFKLSDGFVPDSTVYNSNNIIPQIESVNTDFYVRNS